MLLVTFDVQNFIRELLTFVLNYHMDYLKITYELPNG